MADNYLEKKMEELRSGRLGSRPSGTSRANNALSYTFRPVRVLIAASGRRFLKQYAEPFRRLGCRVAIFNTIPDSDTDLSPDHGTRYYTVGDARHPGMALQSLVTIWRDIDAVIMLDDFAALGEALDRHAATMPYPNDWGRPIITVRDGLLTRGPHAGDCPSPAAVPDEPQRPEAPLLPWLSHKTNSTVSEIKLR